jgi:dinuclear metal center YbgI/SA1388 family protein
MTVKKLYESLCEYFPENLREEWDNDGIMCSADLSAEVNHVLVTLDVTEDVVDYAIETGCDLIVSHHPLIFKPVSALNEENNVSRKLIKLISNNVSVFSFHTRADKAQGGVNDILAKKLGLVSPVSFGEGGMGRIGNLAEETPLDVFADNVKVFLGADAVRYADAYNDVRRVAVLGGDGKDFVRAAIAAGADTYVSGRISYNVMEEAAELGINLVEAGHYFTEMPITERFSEIISSLDANINVETADSNMIKTA